MISDAEAKMEIAVGAMLRVGVSVAAVIVLAGWILYLAHTHGVAPDYRHFHGKPVSPLEIIRDNVRSLGGRNIIELGLLALIATPVARVLFCLAGFAAQKDKLYVLVSGTVLAVLLYSFLFLS